MAQFCTQADVERAIGGAGLFLQLMDPSNSGSVDTQSVQDVLDAGSSEMASYIQLAVEISGLQSPYPRVLVLKTADMCAYHAFTRGSHGQGTPQNIVDKYEAAVRWAKDVGQRQATLGVVPKPSLDPPTELVDSQFGAIPAGFSNGTNDWEMQTQPKGGSISIAGFRRSGFR